MTPERKRRPGLRAAVLLVAGAGLVAAGWLLPVNLSSLSPNLLRAAGEGTRTVGAFGRDLVDFEKPGPAQLVLQTATRLGDPRAPALTQAIQDQHDRQPALTPWGGWDPFLEPLVTVAGQEGRSASTPILEMFLPEVARQSVRAFLANTRSQAVTDILRTGDVTATGRFEPVARPGGQPLEAVVLIAALMVQGDHLAPPLVREVRELAQTAIARDDLGDLETFYLNLLSLSQRLDWVQLSELLQITEDTGTVGEYAHLGRVASDELALIYTAALFTDSADRVAQYLIRYGRPGLTDLERALERGEGATRLLLDRQVPVSSAAVPAVGSIATFSFLHPRLALSIKWLAFLLGAYGVLRGFDSLLFSPVPGLRPTLPHVQGGVISLLLAGLLVLVTEPYLLKAAPPSEFQVRLVMPVLLAAGETPANLPPNTTPTTMDNSTLLSIGFFAALQVGMYLICLMKIREIERSSLTPALKLRLMENEENLFDGGLYIGIAGTASALVLQVLQIIEPNLLAAYSSNLFGIACVALVKIRHVRPYKRSLILRGLETLPAT